MGASYTARPGCPSVPEVACLDQTEVAVWFLAGSSSRQPSIATTIRYAASTEVHCHSPVPSFPHPVGLDGSGSPWASPVCFRTPRYRGACAGWEPIWAQIGAVVTRHGPLIWSDFVSHGLHEMMATFSAKISAGIRPPDQTLPRQRSAKAVAAALRSWPYQPAMLLGTPGHATASATTYLHFCHSRTMNGYVTAAHTPAMSSVPGPRRRRRAASWAGASRRCRGRGASWPP